MSEVARSAMAVPHSRIREIADLAMGMGEGVLRLYFGESNLPTPVFLREAARRAMDEGFTYYTENAGLPSLRAALARYYDRAHAVTLDPRREIVVTASGVQALQVGIRCTLDPGDEAVVVSPCWQNQTSIARMCNADVRMVPLQLEAGRFRIDFDALERAISPRTRLLVYTSPSNPLGWVATVEEQRRLLELARRRGLWLLADEVYERLWYGGSALGEPAPSMLRLATRDDALLVVQSFSKSYAMTGWRVGWLVARADLADRATKLNEFIISCAPAFAQRAAETALEEGEEAVLGMLRLYESNRALCLQMLSGVDGITVPEATGAFYVFPRLAGVTDSFDFCRRLLLETKVGLAPGVAFGEGGEGSIRLCYAVERTLLEEALSRLLAFYRRYRA